MARWTVVGVALAIAVGGCRPRVVYEYEPTVTVTSTERPAPRVGATPAQETTSTTLPPRAPAWLRGGTR